MAINDIYRLTASGTYLGQATKNMFYYKQTLETATDNAETLRTLWIATTLPSLQTIQTQQFFWTRIEVQNIAVVADFDEFNIFAAGSLVTTTQAPPFAACMFSSNRAGFGTRRGYKRIAGLDGALIDGNDYTIGSVILTAVATELGSDLTDALDTFAPVIAKRPIVIGINPSTFLADSWAYQRVTTQNSRKAETLIVA